MGSLFLTHIKPKGMCINKDSIEWFGDPGFLYVVILIFVEFSEPCKFIQKMRKRMWRRLSPPITCLATWSISCIVSTLIFCFLSFSVKYQKFGKWLNVYFGGCHKWKLFCYMHHKFLEICKSNSLSHWKAILPLKEQYHQHRVTSVLSYPSSSVHHGHLLCACE